MFRENQKPIGLKHAVSAKKYREAIILIIEYLLLAFFILLTHEGGLSGIYLACHLPQVVHAKGCLHHRSVMVLFVHYTET